MPTVVRSAAGADTPIKSSRMRLSIHVIALVLTSVLCANASADTSAGTTASEIDELIDRSGLVWVLKILSMPTLYPRLEPTSDQYRQGFDCTSNGSGSQYKKILKEHFSARLSRVEVQQTLGFFSTPTWSKFLSYQREQMLIQLRQSAKLPRAVVSAEDEKALERFFAASPGRLFLLDSIARADDVVPKLFDAHAAAAHACAAGKVP